MPRYWTPAVTVVLFLIMRQMFAGALEDDGNNLERISNITQNSNRIRFPGFMDPEIIRLRRQYWKETFEDIRSLKPTARWKLASNDTSGISRRRFEGFPSWERLLQDWSEDIQDYLDQVNEENEASGYSIGLTPVQTNGYSRRTDEVRDQPFGAEEGPLPSINTTNTPNGSLESLTTSSQTPFAAPKPAEPGELVLPHTSISNQRILIVTTASLPWRTGTAVNPLLRAAYLVPHCSNVTLLLPWLERREDQTRVYGSVFDSPEAQEETLRTWLSDTAALPEAAALLHIQWYTAWQNPVENSIYSMGDITSLVESADHDICILEEPEHLNWYRAPGESWTKKFPHVVGILHTNYFQYALDQPAAVIRAPGMRLLCSWMCRAHCHRVIKLSATLGAVAPTKELVENVHGVRDTFIQVGRTLASRTRAADEGAYFIGKLLWSKGLGSLMELLKYAEESANLQLTVDMYGGGPDRDAAEKKAERLGLDMPFKGPLDHAELAYTHKVRIMMLQVFQVLKTIFPHTIRFLSTLQLQKCSVQQLRKHWQWGSLPLFLHTPPTISSTSFQIVFRMLPKTNLLGTYTMHLRTILNLCRLNLPTNYPGKQLQSA